MLVFLYRQGRQYWRDVVLILALAVVTSSASYHGAQLTDLAGRSSADDVWFQADIARVYNTMTDSWNRDHYRSRRHPLFSLIVFPATYLLKLGLGITPVAAVRIVMAAVAALWVSALFIVLRLMGCQRMDATLFSGLALTSAAAMFWLVVPETYALGSLTLLVALGYAALVQYRAFSPLWSVIVSAVTLSITVTNWMAGILATLATHPWKHSVQITANALCLVTVLYGVQSYLFPHSSFFLGGRGEMRWVLRPESGGPLQVFQSFFFHALVMPEIVVIEGQPPQEPELITQPSAAGSSSWWGTVAVVLWPPLFGLGLWGLFSSRQHRALRLVLGGTLVGQLVLHLLYGGETFLYALHWAPLLVVVGAFSTLTPARWAGRVLAGSLLLSAGMNNGTQFHRAVGYVRSPEVLRLPALPQLDDDQHPEGTTAGLMKRLASPCDTIGGGRISAIGLRGGR